MLHTIFHEPHTAVPKDLSMVCKCACAGFTFELCAGIVDKSKSLAEIVREEILEECGYDVPVDVIRPITSVVAGVGVMGATHHMFYAEVSSGDGMGWI